MRSCHKGNVLPYVVALIFVLTFSGQYVFNAYKVANESTRMQNTSDAAAYSVATVYAQNNNFIALTNRSLVANQITMAQIVTTVSWARMISTVAETINDIGQYIPYISGFTNALEKVVVAVVEVVEIGLSAATSVLGSHIKSISVMQQGAVPLVALIAQDVLEEVVKKNDSDVDYSIAAISIGESSIAYLSEIYGQSDCQDQADSVRDGGSTDEEVLVRCRQFRNVTMASRDGFSANRTYRLVFPEMPEAINLTGIAAEQLGEDDYPISSTLTLERSGSTVMGGDTGDVQSEAPFTNWSAIDATSLHSSTRYLEAEYSHGRFVGFDPDTKETNHQERVKLGLGHAFVGPDDSRNHHIIHEGTEHWGVNPAGSACSDAESDMTEGYGGSDGWKSWNDGAFVLMDVFLLDCSDLSDKFGNDLSSGSEVGLTPFYNLKQEGYVGKQSHTFIYLRKHRKDAKTYKNTIRSSDNRLQLDHQEGAQNDNIHGASAAAIYFRRGNDKWMLKESKRRDNKIEFGNTYTPFWEARLDKLSDAEQASLQALKEF